jgi:hypothetical protein
MCNVLPFPTLSILFARRHVAINVDWKTTRSGERIREKGSGRERHRRTMDHVFKCLWAFVGQEVFLEWDSFAEFRLEEVTFIKKENEVHFFEELRRADTCEYSQNWLYF